LLHPVALWGISVSLSETFKTPPLPCCGTRQGRGLEVALYLICDEQKVWAIFFYFNPFALRVLPLYSLTETPRNAAGHGKGRSGIILNFRYKKEVFQINGIPPRMI